MKRFLSIMLCVMMLVSVFSISASAMVPLKYETAPKQNYVDLQDFSNANVENYPKNKQGTITIEPEAEGLTNKVLKLVTGSSTNITGVVIDNTLTPASFTADDKALNIEFKVYPSVNDEILRVVVNLPFFTEKINNFSKNNTWSLAYSIYGQTFTANTWNTVKIAIDIPDGYEFTSSNPSYPEPNLSDSAAIYVNGTRLTKKTSGLSTASKNRYYVETISAGRAALVSFIYYKSDSKTYLFDDISIYKMVNYPVKHGDIVHTIEEELKVAASAVSFSGTESASTYILNEKITAFGNKAIITFDAKVVTAGYAFCMNVINGSAKMKVNILPTEEIGTDWYTYRVETYVNDERTPSFSDIRVMRRKAGTNDPFVLLKNGTMENGGDYCTDAGSPSGADSTNLQIGYWWAQNALGTFTADQAQNAEWTVRNIQLIEVDEENGAVTGKATANDDGTADVKLFYTTNAGATTPIVAVYNSNEQLVDIEYATEAINGEGEFNANVDYAEGNTVKLFIWDGIATGVPVLNAAVPITVQ